MIAIGIDYGTTNSLVAIYQREMLSKKIKKVHKTSSVYSNGVYVRSPKRLLNDLQSNNPNEITSYIDNCVRTLLIDLQGKLTEEEQSKNIKLAVTVPNAFKDNQCDLLKESILRTFANVFKTFDKDSVEIIPEPVAAALYYAYCLKMNSGQLGKRIYIIVSDMGGGTTDLAIVRMEMKGRELHFKVVASEQDLFLGGDDIDGLISEYLISKYHLVEVDNKYIMSAAQNLKKKLSFNLYRGFGDKADSLLLLENGCYSIDGKELEMVLDSYTLTKLVNSPSIKHPTGFLGTYSNLLERLYNDFVKMLKKEGNNDNSINKILKEQVVLLPIGGSSRLSIIRETFANKFKESSIFDLKTETVIEGSLEANYDSVVRGAAIYSAYRSGLISDFCIKMIIENRTMHNISVRYSSDKICTCVKKNMPDDDYMTVFNPKMISQNGKKFTIGDLEFYQGGVDNILDKDCVKIGTISINDTIYANGRKRDEIMIKLFLKIINGRLEDGRIIVPNGNKDGSDYEKVLEFRSL